MEIPDFEFMLKDHLGNVRAVVGENHSTPGNPDIKSYTNLYAFGAPHPKRNLNQLDQRFSFNGQEQPDEIKGPGLHYNFYARNYDPVYGRWWSEDPYFKRYHSVSPYNFANNNPIFFVDSDGRDKHTYYKIITDQGEAVLHVVTPNEVMWGYTKAGLTHKGYWWHDINEMITFDLRKNANERYSYRKWQGERAKNGISQLLAPNWLQRFDGYFKAGEKEKIEFEYTEDGGFMFTSKFGQNMENKIGRPSAMTNIDDILAITSNFSLSGMPDRASSFANAANLLHAIWDKYTTHAEELTRQSKTYIMGTELIGEQSMDSFHCFFCGMFRDSSHGNSLIRSNNSTYKDKISIPGYNGRTSSYEE